MAKVRRSPRQEAPRFGPRTHTGLLRQQSSRSCRAANEQVMHSLGTRTATGRARKATSASLWIQRINATARLNGTTYSRFTRKHKEEWT